MLTTVYHALITSTLLTWNQGSSLPPSALVEFVLSLLGRLPSSSSVKPSSAVAFGELLVDLLWTVDVELDDVHQDAKLALSNAEQGNAPVVAQGDDAAAVLARVAKTKQNAEADKATLAEIVRALVVSPLLMFYAPYRINMPSGCWNSGSRCLSRKAGTVVDVPRRTHRR